MFQHRYPEITDLAGVPAGQMAPIETLLPRMRLSQLLDLARAYELRVNLNGTKQRVLPIIVAAAEEGVFQRPPKHPYYLARAYYSSDDVKDAKGKMGDMDSGSPNLNSIPAQIKPWHGPLSEPVSTKPVLAVPRETPVEFQRAAELEFRQVKERAKQLGIIIKGKTPKGLRAAVTMAERRLAEKEALERQYEAQQAQEPDEDEPILDDDIEGIEDVAEDHLEPDEAEASA